MLSEWGPPLAIAEGSTIGHTSVIYVGKIPNPHARRVLTQRFLESQRLELARAVEPNAPSPRSAVQLVGLGVLALGD
jgi:hypothetical protein